MNFNIHDALLTKKVEYKKISISFFVKKITRILREMPEVYGGHAHVCLGSLVYDCLHDVYFSTCCLGTFSNFFLYKYVLLDSNKRV